MRNPLTNADGALHRWLTSPLGRFTSIDLTEVAVFSTIPFLARPRVRGFTAPTAMGVSVPMRLTTDDVLAIELIEG